MRREKSARKAIAPMHGASEATNSMSVRQSCPGRPVLVSVSIQRNLFAPLELRARRLIGLRTTAHEHA